MNLAHQIRCSKHTKPLGVITRLWRTRLFTHQIWWVMACYDLAHQIRCAKHTFRGRCDITPMVCCSFGEHSTPQFLQCTITVKLHSSKLLQTSRVYWSVGRSNVRKKLQYLLSDCWLVKLGDVWQLLCRSLRN